MRHTTLASAGILVLAAACVSAPAQHEPGPAGGSQPVPIAAEAGVTTPTEASAEIGMTATATATTNPLLLAWSGPYGGVPPWDMVRPELFPEAFQAAIDARRAEYPGDSEQQPSRRRSRTRSYRCRTPAASCSRVLAMFSVMTNNMNTPEYQALDREWSPRLAAARMRSRSTRTCSAGSRRSTRTGSRRA
jgi:hypothetical protein